MSRISAVKQAVFGGRLYGKKTKTSLLITTALALTPLIIDSMLTDDSFQCPKSKTGLMSGLLLLGPGICISLLGLSHSIKYFREHENRSAMNMFKRLMARMFMIGVMMSVTVGSSFLLSEHYACWKNGAPIVSNTTRTLLVSESRQIGWFIIMTVLMTSFFIVLLQLIFNKTSYVDKSLKVFISHQRKASKQMLEDALQRLADRLVKRRLESASKHLSSFSDEENENIADIISVFKKEKMEIIKSKRNFVNKKLSLKEKLHFFSLSLDDCMEAST